jgi:hypothetical protein
VIECRACRVPLSEVFADLGMLPLPNAYYAPDEQHREERFPLVVHVCGRCFLVQAVPVGTTESIFGHYAYFSSYAQTALDSARDYCSRMLARLALGGDALVVEAGSNDGYLLQYFRDANVPVLGIEPAANIAAVARDRGIDTWAKPFGVETATRIAGRAELLIANNVLAHVPDLHDFVGGLKIALAPRGTITIEFPHLMPLIEGTLFDTIYHEHFSYLSLLSVSGVLAAHELEVVDLEELPTHGGSLRLFIAHRGAQPVRASVIEARRREREFGLDRIDSYRGFAGAVAKRTREIRDFLLAARGEGQRIAGYGAPAKASTLLNHCGIGPDVIEYTVDRSPHKQGRFVPGTAIPIHAPERIDATRPDCVVIFPWNLRDEILAQMGHVRGWGARFVVTMPRVEVIG